MASEVNELVSEAVGMGGIKSDVIEMGSTVNPDVAGMKSELAGMKSEVDSAMADVKFDVAETGSELTGLVTKWPRKCKPPNLSYKGVDPLAGLLPRRRRSAPMSTRRSAASRIKAEPISEFSFQGASSSASSDGVGDFVFNHTAMVNVLAETTRLQQSLVEANAKISACVTELKKHIKALEQRKEVGTAYADHRRRRGVVMSADPPRRWVGHGDGGSGDSSADLPPKIERYEKCGGSSDGGGYPVNDNNNIARFSASSFCGGLSHTQWNRSTPITRSQGEGTSSHLLSSSQDKPTTSTASMPAAHFQRLLSAAMRQGNVNNSDKPLGSEGVASRPAVSTTATAKTGGRLYLAGRPVAEGTLAAVIAHATAIAAAASGSLATASVPITTSEYLRGEEVFQDEPTNWMS